MDPNAAYANAAYIKHAESFPLKWQQQAQNWREHANARLDIPYGPDARQKLDLFLPKQRPKGLAMFIHGGYWQAFGRKDWSHLAAGCVARGWAVAVPSYRLAPDVRIADITQDIVAALEMAAGMIAGPIAVTGHSAGGHLSARMVCDGVGLAPGVQGRIARVAPISPVADLRPLLGLDMNEVLRLDDAEAAAESPVLCAPVAKVGVDVWVGANERPVFIEQAGWLADAWDGALYIEPGKHHFDVIDALADPKSALVARLLGENRVTG
ncbi:MAG: alpha/beta hydrolase [Paracoccaceae bacterium]